MSKMLFHEHVMVLYKQFQRSQRYQMDKETYIVTIQTHDAVFSNERYKEFEGYKNGFSLCLARGNKFACTKNKPITIDPTNKMRVIEFNEPLSLVVTLYKDKKTGEYQEKTGKLVLRTFDSEQSKYQGLCAYKLKFHSLISQAIQDSDDVTTYSKDYIWPINGDGELALDCQFTFQRINFDSEEMAKMVDSVVINSSKSYHFTADADELKRNNKIASLYNAPNNTLDSTPNVSPASSKNREFSPVRTIASSSESLDSKSSRAERIQSFYGKELKYPSLASSKENLVAMIEQPIVNA